MLQQTAHVAEAVLARVLRLGTDTRAKSVVEVLEMLAQLVDFVERKSPAHKFCVSSIRVHTANICHKSAVWASSRLARKALPFQR